MKAPVLTMDLLESCQYFALSEQWNLGGELFTLQYDNGSAVLLVGVETVKRPATS